MILLASLLSKPSLLFFGIADGVPFVTDVPAVAGIPYIAGVPLAFAPVFPQLLASQFFISCAVDLCCLFFARSFACFLSLLLLASRVVT
jgi:hypothetical protein